MLQYGHHAIEDAVQRGGRVVGAEHPVVEPDVDGGETRGGGEQLCPVLAASRSRPPVSQCDRSAGSYSVSRR